MPVKAFLRVAQPVPYLYGSGLQYYSMCFLPWLSCWMVFLFDWFFVGFGFGGGGGIKQKTVSMQMYAMILLA